MAPASKTFTATSNIPLLSRYARSTLQIICSCQQWVLSGIIEVRDSCLRYNSGVPFTMGRVNGLVSPALEGALGANIHLARMEASPSMRACFAQHLLL